MATNTNTITVAGNLTRDPELRFTSGGKAVCSFSIAVSKSRKDPNGDWKEQTSFFSITCWDRLAENVAASLTKGAAAFVVGRLEQREYDGKDGNKVKTVEIVADEVGASLRFATATLDRNERSTETYAPRATKTEATYGEEEPF